MKHRRYYADRITVFDVVYGDRPLKKYLMIVMVLALAMSGIASAEVSSSDLKYPDLPEPLMPVLDSLPAAMDFVPDVPTAAVCMAVPGGS